MLTHPWNKELNQYPTQTVPSHINDAGVSPGCTRADINTISVGPPAAFGFKFAGSVMVNKSSLKNVMGRHHHNYAQLLA